MSPELLEIRRERVRLLAAEVAKESGIPAVDILGRGRDPEVMRARHRLWSMLRDSGLTWLVIGVLVERNHTTVMAGVRKHRAEALPKSCERPTERRTA